MTFFLHMRSSFGWLGEVIQCLFVSLTSKRHCDTVQQLHNCLKCLFDCGINGKVWRLLNSAGTPNQIQVNGMLSSAITLECGILQGSVISATLFLLAMDELEYLSVGSCLTDELYYSRVCRHDDIWNISTSYRDTLHEQISIVESFSTTNALVL